MKINMFIFFIFLIIISGCITKNQSQNIDMTGKSIDNTTKNQSKSIDMVMTELAKKDAIKRFNISETKSVSIIPVQWTDTSLGYPEKGKQIGKDYTIETIKGFVIIIQGDDKLYEYHSDYSRIVPPESNLKNII